MMQKKNLSSLRKMSWTEQRIRVHSHTDLVLGNGSHIFKVVKGGCVFKGHNLFFDTECRLFASYEPPSTSGLAGGQASNNDITEQRMVCDKIAPFVGVNWHYVSLKDTRWETIGKMLTTTGILVQPGLAPSISITPRPQSGQSHMEIAPVPPGYQRGRSC
jgi:hypothetical protein